MADMPEPFADVIVALLLRMVPPFSAPTSPPRPVRREPDMVPLTELLKTVPDIRPDRKPQAVVADVGTPPLMVAPVSTRLASDPVLPTELNNPMLDQPAWLRVSPLIVWPSPSSVPPKANVGVALAAVLLNPMGVQAPLSVRLLARA